MPLYAAHGVPEFWLIDLNAKELTCCRRPRDRIYDDVAVMTAADLTAPFATQSGIRVELGRLFDL